MKLLITLLILVGCTSNDPKSTPTESDAKPVSPYTAEPCICMKIYRPVCAEGRTFGNSCEAECNGHTKWTEGMCK